MGIPDRRTLIVLASLVAAMTLASGVLLVLEPRPMAPMTGVSLSSLDRAAQPKDVLFATTPAPQPGRWQSIVIYHSGLPTGSARTIGQAHENAGLSGLGYHFVIGNGQGADDGQIEVGFRWRHQFPGAHATGQYANWFNQYAIGICLVGNGDRQQLTQAQTRELLWLVHQLQARFHIPPQRVLLHSDIDRTTSPGKLFPAARFRQQLLPVNAP